MNENLLLHFGKDYKERVEKAIQALTEKKGFLLVDDEDRENEGDLIYAAQNMTVSDMALMIRECSGIVCLCLPHEKMKQLDLPQMVTDNSSRYHTAFTVSIEAKEGVTTGVSAADRLTTIKAAIQDSAKPDDLSRPGHVFPLEAREGGVFTRRGHTEGSVDMVQLAGLKSAAVLCELTNEDGTMAKLPELVAFAHKHQMTIVSIEDIYQYKKLHKA
ncbi:MAG: 3,4-dihydroxy-2-butanone-4-phosphate synthase [Bacteroidota bacterium]|nr:3,4-dihydroxy-2-butanone-4-phosphate synthase [Bacteroidota bacterium]MDP4206074.1 3,4-dihydroxy-2-butanone-4-phosphate synthase [Bacteroidota bacterium]